MADGPQEGYEPVDANPDHVVEADDRTVNVSTIYLYARNCFNIKDSKNINVNVGSDVSSNTKLCFNSLHGKEVYLTKDTIEAKRTKGYKNGICFANNPFAKNIPVHLKVTDTFEDTYGRCRMGFTNRDPHSLAGSGILQKGVETAQSSEGFVVIEPSMDTCAYPGAVIFFFYSNGVVTSRSSKDGAIQTFPCPNVFQEDDDLWAFIELRGPVKSVEVENNTFHDVCGSLSSVQENRACQGWWYTLGCQGGLVCFTKTPLSPGQHVDFKLSQVHVNSAGHMRVGICKENPDLIRPENLPHTLVSHPQYVTMEIGADDAVCGNIISLVPVESQLCVLVNNNKQVGVLNLDKHIDKTWAVVELFGKTKAVEIVAQLPRSDPQTGKVSERHQEREKDPEIGRLLSSAARVWLESQVLMNTLKSVAEAIVNHLDGTNPGAYWNSVLAPVESAASYVGLESYVHMAEVGDAPEILRANLPNLIGNVQDFVTHIDEIKVSTGKIGMITVSPGQSEQFKLLRSIAAGLPHFEVQLPRLHPSSPPPTPLLLDLSPLPVDIGNLQGWYKPVVVRTLLETANTIEASFNPLDRMIRQLYTYGI